MSGAKAQRAVELHAEDRAVRNRVVKLGRGWLNGTEAFDALARLLVRLERDGFRPWVVHGGGDELARVCARLDAARPRELGLHITSTRSMEVATMVTCGLVNARLVAALGARGLSAFGLNGADCAIMRSRFLNQPRLGRVGGPPKIDLSGLQPLVDARDTIPVVASVCLGPDDDLLDVDADSVAQALAVALGASALDFVTDVDAIFSNDAPLQRVSAERLDDLAASAEIDGGMIHKLQAIAAALEGGVRQVRVGSIHSLVSGDCTWLHA